MIIGYLDPWGYKLEPGQQVLCSVVLARTGLTCENMKSPES